MGRGRKQQEGGTGSRSTASKPPAKPFQIAAKASKNNGIVIVTHTHTQKGRKREKDGGEEERMKGRRSVEQRLFTYSQVLKDKYIYKDKTAANSTPAPTPAPSLAPVGLLGKLAR